MDGQVLEVVPALTGQRAAALFGDVGLPLPILQQLQILVAKKAVVGLSATLLVVFDDLVAELWTIGEFSYNLSTVIISLTQRSDGRILLCVRI